MISDPQWPRDGNQGPMACHPGSFFFLMAISEIPLKNGGFRWENPALPRLITGGYIVQAG